MSHELRFPGLIQPDGDTHPGDRRDAGGVADETYQTLVPPSEHHGVVPADIAVLAPSVGRVAVQEAALHRQVHRQQVARVPVGDEVLDFSHQLRAQRVPRYDLSDKVGLPKGCLGHVARLPRVSWQTSPR